MKKKLASVLRTEFSASLPALAELIRSQGRGKDSILAHITPQEAEMLKEKGGSGTINPQTGLPEFDTSGIDFVNVTPSPVTTSLAAQGYTPPPIAPVTVTPSPVASSLAAQGYTPPAIEPVTVTPSPVASSLAAQGYLPPSTPIEPVTVTPSPVAPSLAAQGYLPPTTPIEPVTVTPSRVSIPGYAPGGAPTAAPEPSLGQQIGGFLGNNATLLAAALGLGGALAGRAGAALPAQTVQGISANVAAPLQATVAQGQQQLRETLAGNLTPSSMQAFQAAQAQIAQGQARGAVGSQQAAEAMAQTYANLMQGQLNQSLAILSQVSPVLQNAYVQGYNTQATAAANNAQFYANLAQLMAGGGIGNIASTISNIVG